MRKYLISVFFVLLPFMLLAQAKDNRITFKVDKLERFSTKMVGSQANTPITIEGGTADATEVGASKTLVYITPTADVVTVIGDLTQFWAHNPAASATKLTKLTELSIDGHSTLEKVRVAGNAITSVKITNCPAFKELLAFKNVISAVEFSGLPLIEQLHLDNNALEAINLDGVTNLQKLRLEYTPITELDVSMCPNLTWLYLTGSKVRKVDVSQNKKLERITFSHCKEVQEVDLSGNTETLEEVNISNSTVHTIRFADAPYDALKKIVANDSKLTSLTPPQGAILKTIDVAGTAMTTAALDALYASLKDCQVTGGELILLNLPGDEREDIVAATTYALMADKGWTPKRKTNKKPEAIPPSFFKGNTAVENAYFLSFTQCENATLKVSVNGTVITESQAVKKGDKIVATFTPDPGYAIASFLFNGEPVQGSEKSIDVSEAIRNYVYEVSVEKLIPISITPSDIVNITLLDAADTPLDYANGLKVGQAVKVKVEPKTGKCKVTSIKVNGEKLSGVEFTVLEGVAEYKIVVTAERIITLEFAAIEHGKLKVFAEQTQLDAGAELTPGTTKLTFEAEPADGYELSKILVNGTAIEGLEYLVPADAEKCAVSAEFKEKSSGVIKLEFAAIEHGTLKVFAEQTQLDAGAELTPGTTKLTFVAEPADGYELSKILINGTAIDGLEYLVPADAKKCAVSAEFKEKSSGGAEQVTAVSSELLANTRVAPNPFHATIQVMHAGSISRYALYNSLGELIFSGVHNGSNTLVLDGSSLPMGIYLLRLDAADGARVIRVVRDR